MTDNSKDQKLIKWSGKRNNVNFHEKSGVVYLTSPLLDGLGWLKHGFSTRLGGVSAPPADTMNLSCAHLDTRENVSENFRILAEAAGIDASRIVTSGQIHSANITVVDRKHSCSGGEGKCDFLDNDGTVTDVPGISLFAMSADCPVVLMADDEHHAVSACHSGWRGTVLDITGEALRVMSKQYGTRPDCVYAFIAPSICQECFEVEEDVISKIKELISEEEYDRVFYKKNEKKYQLNLWEVIRRRLVMNGVPESHIEIAGVCSKCNPDYFFSHRRSGFERGTCGGFIMIKVQ